jgi:hypothetical protein
MAFESHRAAHTAATILEMDDAGVGRSFYYHVWDQTNYSFEFERFFTDPVIMTKHWNEQPHRFGLFGVNEEVRPQYFVFQMLGAGAQHSAHRVASGLKYAQSAMTRNLFCSCIITQATADLIVAEFLMHSRKQLKPTNR